MHFLEVKCCEKYDKCLLKILFIISHVVVYLMITNKL